MGSFAPKGHARVDPASPRAFAICDRCGFMYNHSDLSWDRQWHGNQIKRTGFLVCEKCADEPNPTMRPIKLPADPVPILNPRSEPVHCHVFKPRADGATAVFKADLKSRMFPPVDKWKDITADTGATCDTRTYKDGWSVPIPPGTTPIPPEPPIEPPDATGDNQEATSDTTSTSADAGPLYAYDSTTDTTMMFADTGVLTTDGFPVLTQAPPEADTSWQSADSMTWTADASPDPWIYKGGNTADTTNPMADNQMSPTDNVNAYPDYLYAADVPTVRVDNASVRSDNIT